MTSGTNRSVVTGGAGFVGSHLVELLLERGDEVVVLDDLSTGDIRNLATVLDHPRFHLRSGSVMEKSEVRSAVRGADRIFHLAAAVGAHAALGSPLAGMRINIHGTENVLDSALDSSAEVLLVSTAEVFGKNAIDTLSEDSDRVLGTPLRSRWTYAAARGINEAYGHAYWTERGLPVRIVRLFDTIGPRQVGQYGMVVPHLVAEAMAGEPMTVFGDGEQTRCFAYVGDVVPAMVAVQESKGSIGRAYNIGGTEAFSVNHLARRVARVTRSHSRIVHVPRADRQGSGREDQHRHVPDNTAVRRLVGYAPTTTLDEMIARIAETLGARRVRRPRIGRAARSG